jgi:hypothetical protein
VTRLSKTSSLLAGIYALALSSTGSAEAQGQPGPSDVAGTWNNRSVTITRSGSDFIVRISNTRGPLAGSYVGDNRIRVVFPNAQGCCTGVISGNVINWSNGTQWRRDVSAPAPGRVNLAGSWNGGTATMVPRGDGFVVRLSNGRGPFAGSYTGGDGIRVNFVDDRGCCTGRVVGREIRWSNGTVWRKDF